MHDDTTNVAENEMLEYSDYYQKQAYKNNVLH